MEINKNDITNILANGLDKPIKSLSKTAMLEVAISNILNFYADVIPQDHTTASRMREAVQFGENPRLTELENKLAALLATKFMSLINFVCNLKNDEYRPVVERDVFSFVDADSFVEVEGGAEIMTTDYRRIKLKNNPKK